MGKNRDSTVEPNDETDREETPPRYRSTAADGSATTSDVSGIEPELTVDTALELLGARRRRMVLAHFVSDPEQTSSTEQLIDQLQEWETAVGKTHPNHCEHIRRDLHYVHLPRLEANGILEYDTTNQRWYYLGSPLIEQLLDATVRQEAWF